MRMQEAMAALGSGQTIDVRQVLSGQAASPPADANRTAAPQQRAERQVSLG